MAQLGIRKRDHAMPRLKSLMAARLLVFTVPEKPKSRRQKYITTAVGLDYADRHPVGQAKPDSADCVKMP